jgi:hypothetical protein
MNKDVQKEISFIKTILKMTKVSYNYLSIFFIGIAILSFLRQVIYRLIYMVNKNSLLFNGSIHVAYVSILLLFYIYYYRKMTKSQNSDNMILLHIWGIVLIVHEFVSLFMINIVLVNITEVTSNYNIYVHCSFIIESTLTMIPIIIGVIITGIIIDDNLLKIYGFLLIIFYIISMYLFSLNNMQNVVFGIYNVVYIVSLVFIGIIFRYKYYKMKGN